MSMFWAGFLIGVGASTLLMIAGFLLMSRDEWYVANQRTGEIL